MSQPDRTPSAASPPDLIRFPVRDGFWSSLRRVLRGERLEKWVEWTDEDYERELSRV